MFLPDHHVLRQSQTCSGGELWVRVASRGAADFHQQGKESTQQVLL